MDEETIVIKLKDEEYPLNVSKQRLIADSSTFRYLIEELNQDELQFDDFSPEIVTLFITLLDDRKLEDVENAHFRELNKLAVVFKVEWLKDDCKKWLEGKMDCADSDEEKEFIFEECLYILNKWKQRDMMEALLSKLSTQNNASFLSQYMTNLDRLETVQLDLLLKLGGSNSVPFLRTILTNLEGKRELDENVKHLLKHMNLALCFEQNKELYGEVCETLQNLSDISVDDMKFAFQLSTQTTRSVSSRSEERKTRTTVVFDDKKVHDDLLDSCNTMTVITDAVLNNKATSMYLVVELLLWVYIRNTPSTEDTQILGIFITTLENICTERKPQKVSKQHLEMIIDALHYSPLPQRVQLITLLNEINDNDKLSTYHENIHIKCDKGINVSPITGQRVLSTVKHFMTRDKSIPAGTVHKYLFTFKHPSTVECTEPGNCGFIIRSSKPDEMYWIDELCTNSKDYEGTGLHLHDIISASDMYAYGIWSGNTAPDNKVQVAGRWSWWEYWLPDVTCWACEQYCVEYNISDYVVTKQD